MALMNMMCTFGLVDGNVIFLCSIFIKFFLLHKWSNVKFLVKICSEAGKVNILTNKIKIFTFSEKVVMLKITVGIKARW